MDIQQSSNNPIEPQGAQVSQNFAKKIAPFKKYLIPIGVILLIVLGYLWYKNQGMQSTSKSTGTVTLQEGGITREQKLAALSEKERNDLEERLAKYEADIKAFTDQTSQEDKDKKYIVVSGLQRSLGLYEEALASLGKISSEYKNQARVFLTYALTYKDIGDLDKAAEYAKKSLDIDQENQQAWVAYLESEQSLNNADREAKYVEAVQKTDSHENVLVSYAKFLEKIGNIQGAIEQYKKAGETNQRLKPEFDKEISRLEGAK